MIHVWHPDGTPGSMCGVLLRELPRGEKITNGWHNVTCPKCREQIAALSKEQPPCPPT